ncbi:hypothetical protein [Thalassobacillus pellis]|uniref:hypothetical protein n=1 Tax=Thalassobacillus pellis TaxID=748008 RepID=UPI0019621640|nr:hypothetical protein [Thalassobacillus pellis]MBM7554556.1 hypothetical protein [Thalassobacillus pellis]
MGKGIPLPLETKHYFSKNVRDKKRGDVATMDPEEAKQKILEATRDPQVKEVRGPQNRKDLDRMKDPTYVYYKDGTVVIYSPYTVHRVV